MDALARFLGTLLTPIIIAAVKTAIAEMKDTGEVGKKEGPLDDLWKSTEKPK